MNERAPSAYFSSLLLHGLAIAIIVVLGYVSTQSTPDSVKVMELVAGPGDNYMGKEATKLGSETGIALNIPATTAAPAPPAPAPEPAPAPPAPIVPAEPVPPPPVAAPPQPVAKPVVPTKKPAAKLPANPMLKTVTKAEIKAESKVKMHDLKVKKEEEKLAAAAKKAESYAEFMKGQHGPAAAAAPKGRAGGVAAGTTMANGAGGHALTAEQVDEIAAWNALLRQRWVDGFVPPPDFDQKMVAQVTFHVAASGSISGIHVTGSTGGPAFESAVAEALRHVTMPPYPAKRGEDFIVPFSLRDQG